jgi:uncharacterized repeat protein (TIGR01451 family)
MGTILNARIALAAATLLTLALLVAPAVPAGAAVTTAQAWGSNGYGELGDGTTGQPRPTPGAVSGLSSPTDVSAGYRHSLALRSDGAVAAWGDNTSGKLGHGSDAQFESTPVTVSGLADAIAISAGDHHNLALRAGGTVVSWGANADGQLGDGTKDPRSTPVPVSGLSNVIAIAGGGYHSLALTSTGTVVAWGYNNSGQVGNNGVTQQTTPVAVPDLTNVVAIAAGRYHSVALRSDGTVWSWGQNGDGQLGNNSKFNSGVPVQASGLTDVSAIAAGEYHTLALRSDATVAVWGDNDFGQLGTGDKGERLTPAAASGLTDAIMIAAGKSHSLAVRENRTAVAWGANASGQLGDGTLTSPRLTPVPVSGSSDVDAIAGGFGHSVALQAPQPTEEGSADLSVQIAVNQSTAQVGDLVTYTIVVTNLGPDAATGVTLTDGLPHEVAFSSVNDDQCDHSGGTLTCTLGSLAVGQPREIRLVVAVNAPGTVSNTVAVTSNMADPDGSNNSAGVTFTAESPEETTSRIAGTSRIETAIKSSQSTFADQTAAAVVLARANDFPDALAGAALAVDRDGPLLLNPTEGLLPEVKAEIERILPAGGTVFVLGGIGAISQAVEDGLVAAGFTVRRLSGADRFETAVRIAEELDPDVLFLATARNFPDALTAGAAAAEVNGALLLTEDREMNAASAAFIAANAALPRFAAGGQAAAADPDATPLVGADRYATALAVADQFFPQPVSIGLATGVDFPDALAGVAHIGRRHGPMLLSKPDELPDSVSAWIRDRADSIQIVFLFGGERALSAAVETQVRDALS